MKSTELRIGNNVDVTIEELSFTDGKITKLCVEHVYVNGVKMRYEHLRPTTLIKEWWPKFGYESIQEFACDLSEKAENHLGVDIDFYNECGIDLIESLPIHKIQNLFYELTGEELALIDLKNKQL